MATENLEDKSEEGKRITAGLVTELIPIFVDLGGPGAVSLLGDHIKYAIDHGIHTQEDLAVIAQAAAEAYNQRQIKMADL